MGISGNFRIDSIARKVIIITIDTQDTILYELYIIKLQTKPK